MPLRLPCCCCSSSRSTICVLRCLAGPVTWFHMLLLEPLGHPAQHRDAFMHAHSGALMQSRGNGKTNQTKHLECVQNTGGCQPATGQHNTTSTHSTEACCGDNKGNTHSKNDDCLKPQVDAATHHLVAAAYIAPTATVHSAHDTMPTVRRCGSSVLLSC